MSLIVDFLLPRKPVSHQAKNRENLNDWTDFVYARALAALNGRRPIVGRPLKFTMVFLADEEDQGDINNFVKPVQDALNALVYADDELVIDVSAHKRVLSEPIEIAGLPKELAYAVIDAMPCVYVAISNSGELVKELI